MVNAGLFPGITDCKPQDDEVMKVNTIMLIGGSLDAFANFRLHLLQSLLANSSAQIVCVYFGNKEGVVVPTISPERCRWVDLKGSHISNPLADFLPVAKLALLLFHIRPDVILAFNAKPLFFAGLLKRLFFFRGPIIALLEGLGIGFSFLKSESFSATLKKKIIFWPLSVYDRWVFLNQHDRDIFASLKILNPRSETLLINGIGVDLTHFSNRYSEQVTWRYKAVGFAGRLISEKGPQIVAETARLVHLEMPDVEFHMAGRMTSHSSNITEEDINSWLYSGAIKSIQYYSDSKNFYRNLSLILLPTTYNEGLPAVAMEGQAMGLPVLLNKIPQTLHALNDTKSGYLVEGNDAETYSRLILSLFRDCDVYSQISKQSRHFAEEHFDQEKINKRLSSFILNAL